MKIMTLFRSFAVTAASVLSFFSWATSAQYSDACSDGTCNLVQAIAVAAPCGVDPNDGSNFAYGIGVCPCSDGEIYTVAVTYTGVDGSVTSETASTAAGASSTASALTFDFPNANTQIQPDSIVTFNVQDNLPENYGAHTYTHSPVTSLYFTAATSTISSTTGTVTSTSSTTTVTSTSIIAQSTTTTPCTTGTLTSTASPSTTTITSTITPSAKTVKLTEVILSTTHLSCYPQPGFGQKQRGLAARQVNTGTFETAWCPYYLGAPAPTTYTTSTSLLTTTITTTDTSTSTDTVTATATSTPTPLTTTLCSNVEGTVITKPTVTATKTTTLKPVTKTSTREFILVETIFPRRAKPCRPSKAPTKVPGAKSCPVLAPTKSSRHH
ncbi:hypothetical protein EV356DRAFT_316316 [Viridothelium virens]|uniref:Uncharacterized protein n=1 Tax=Viridothelium virens TaxID=1048519 RepID=A0A6A6H049_VIRVR|nr:hypothetical protein EV356DRAFT_316316 [Viridothelium virens]